MRKTGIGPDIDWVINAGAPIRIARRIRFATPINNAQPIRNMDKDSNLR
jgi:hypothetical protein